MAREDPEQESRQARVHPFELHHSQELRTHYSQELHSSAAIGDFVRFLVWLTLGACLQHHAQQLFHRHHTPNHLFTDPMWCCVSLEMCIAFVAAYIMNWWLLSVSTGGLSYLLFTNWNLDRKWNGCEGIEYVAVAYIMTQSFAAVLGPLVTWWLTWSSQAMDRVIEDESYQYQLTTESKWITFLFGFGRRHQHHHGRLGCYGQGERPTLRLKLEPPANSNFCSFYWDVGGSHFHFFRPYVRRESEWIRDPGHPLCRFLPCCVPGGDDQEMASPQSQKSQASEQCQKTEQWDCVLIHTRSGEAAKLTLSPANHNAADEIVSFTFDVTADDADDPKYDADQIRTILQSHKPLLLHMRSIQRPEKQALLHTRGGCLQALVDQFGTQYECDPSPCLHWLVALLLFAGMYAVALSLGGVGYATIFFLLLPKLVEDLTMMRNGTAASLESRIFNGTLDVDFAETFKDGWKCVSPTDIHGKDYMIEFSAVWVSTFIMTGCAFSLIYACHYLHVASGMLGMLNDLLLLDGGNGNKKQKARLWKLHTIRSRVNHKRFLEFFARDSLPDLDVDNLQWWIDTRAVLYQDISFNLEKRKPILGMYTVAEFMLIVATLVSFLSHQLSFATACYAVTYGCALGILILLFVFLCSRVNDELKQFKDYMGKPKDGDKSKLLGGAGCAKEGGVGVEYQVMHSSAGLQESCFEFSNAGWCDNEGYWYVGWMGGYLLLYTSSAAFRLARGKSIANAGRGVGQPGTYTVEDEWQKIHTVSRENLKVDSVTAPVL
eukprot:Skav228994  [mRNA]  locus=scaffold127:143809:159020:+ [translate_table: standard]